MKKYILLLLLTCMSGVVFGSVENEQKIKVRQKKIANLQHYLKSSLPCNPNLPRILQYKMKLAAVKEIAKQILDLITEIRELSEEPQAYLSLENNMQTILDRPSPVGPLPSVTFEYDGAHISKIILRRNPMMDLREQKGTIEQKLELRRQKLANLRHYLNSSLPCDPNLAPILQYKMRKAAEKEIAKQIIEVIREIRALSGQPQAHLLLANDMQEILYRPSPEGPLPAVTFEYDGAHISKIILKRNQK